MLLSETFLSFAPRAGHFEKLNAHSEWTFLFYFFIVFLRYQAATSKENEKQCFQPCFTLVKHLAPQPLPYLCGKSKYSGHPQAGRCYREGAENQYSSPNSQIDFVVHPIVPLVLIVQLMSHIQVLPKFVYQVMD
jgi:hypothetical protein